MRLYEFSDGTVIDLEKITIVHPVENNDRYLIEYPGEESLWRDEKKKCNRKKLLEAWRKYHNEDR